VPDALADGPRVDFHGASFCDGDAASTFEQVETRLLRQLLRPVRALGPGQRVLQAGVGMGWLLAVAAALVGPRRVVGYEANPQLAQLVAENVRVDGEPLLVVPKGLAVHAHRARFTTGGNVSSAPGAEIWAGGHLAATGEGDQLVPVEAIRTAINSLDAGVLALDVEGAEAQLVPEAARCDRLRAMLVEVHRPAHGVEDALDPDEWRVEIHGGVRDHDPAEPYYLTAVRR
jgi:FkbM family methyltransferase